MINRTSHSIKVTFSLLRIKHWLKNVLILMPLFFSGQVFDLNNLKTVSIGFFSFSLAASAVYVLNDYLDYEKDRIHPKKRYRAIASGAVSKKLAIVIGVLVLLAAVLLNLTLGWQSLLVLVMYVVLNIFYSLWLKHLVIFDVLTIALGFALRIIYGGLIIDIPLSPFLLYAVIFLSLFMAFGKRRNELVQQGSNARSVLNSYTSSFLDKNMYMCLGLALMFFSLWSMQDQENLFKIAAVPIAAVALIRYSLVVESGNSDGDPSDVLTSDVPLLVAAALLALSLFLGVYVA